MLFLVTVTVLLASVNARFYTICDSSLSTIENIVISGCPEEASECVLPRNTDVTFNVTFRPRIDLYASELESEVRALVLIGTQPEVLSFSLQNYYDCEGGSSCFLQTEQQYTLSAVVKIEQNYPAIPIDLRWTVATYEGERFEHVYEVCIDINARLQ